MGDQVSKIVKIRDQTDADNLEIAYHRTHTVKMPKLVLKKESTTRSDPLAINVMSSVYTFSSLPQSV